MDIFLSPLHAFRAWTRQLDLSYSLLSKFLRVLFRPPPWRVATDHLARSVRSMSTSVVQHTSQWSSEQWRYGRQRHWRQTTRAPEGRRLQTVRRAGNSITEHSCERRISTTGVFDKARARVDTCRLAGTVRLYRYWPLVRFRRIFLNEMNRIRVKYSTTNKHNTLTFVIQC